MTTLREIHERCKARHSDLWTHPATRNTYCVRCDLPAPCADYSDAEAALNLLDKAERPVGHYINGRIGYRLVPDPPACSSASTPPHTHKETTT